MSLDKNNMKIPADYFDGLADKLSARVEGLEDDIETNAPTLFKIGKNEGYSIPSEYFKTFAERQKKLKPRRRIIKLITPVIGIAASALLLFGWFISQNQSTSIDEGQLGDVEMYQYLIENVDMLDDELLADLNGYLGEDESAADIEYLLDNIDELDIIEFENF